MIIQSEAGEFFSAQPEKSIQCIVTSPPYFTLKKYKGGKREIGREDLADCLGWATGNTCGQCYICSLRSVFRGAYRALCDDGVLWLNIGDTFAKSNTVGFAEKEMMGIPWRVAFGLRADKWLLRMENIWWKNSKPESMKDRTTYAHEQVFLLTKRPRYKFNEMTEFAEYDGRNEIMYRGSTKYDKNADDGQRQQTMHRTVQRWRFDENGKAIRNKRSVWKVATARSTKKHYAVFPEDLIEPCVLAGSDEGDVVCDPFMGSGTTAAVALRHNRKVVGCDLNAEYVAMTNERIAQYQKRLI